MKCPCDEEVRIYLKERGERVGECLHFMGYRDKDGYGKTAWGKTAHSESFRVFVGPISKYCDIAHTCDMRSCIEPKHLTCVPYTLNRQNNQYKDAEECKRGHRTWAFKKSGTRYCWTCNQKWFRDQLKKEPNT
jgi:hypothetical protein